MHLWPSMRLRDSFKTGYLKKLEFNLHRMKSEKKQQKDSQTSTSNANDNDYQQKLLDDNINKIQDSAKGGKVLAICRELLLLVSCCYCCFCCGGGGSGLEREEEMERDEEPVKMMYSGV